jgi:hypothetical protein
MAMFGDAISHAVLPGLVLAFLISGSRESMYMLPGAALTGLLVTFIIEWIQKRMRIQNDAAIGLVYTFLFALGVILVSAYTAQTDLDQECVLYGEIAYVPFDLILDKDGFSLGPRQVWIAGSLLILLLGVLFSSYRALYITTFDSGYATALGISVAFWHYVLMGIVRIGWGCVGHCLINWTSSYCGFVCKTVALSTCISLLYWHTVVYWRILFSRLVERIHCGCHFYDDWFLFRNGTINSESSPTPIIEYPSKIWNENNYFPKAIFTNNIL